MAGRLTPHPPAAQWQAFASGALDLQTREAMTEHLRACRECQAVSADVVANARDAETRDGAPPPEPDTQDARTLDGSPRAEERRAAAEEAKAPPQRLGRYLVLDVIGSGGMGEVLLAYDPALDRRVAIKVAQRQAGGSESKGLDVRLEREAQALARAADRHVVAVYDTGRVDNRPYVAMEYVPGTTLKAWLGTPRSSKEVLRVFTEAARGLAAAHRVGVVHRDFKPENVLIDEKGVAHVTDFGLATLHGDPGERPEKTPVEQPQSESDTQDVFNTQRGAVLGTPAYMPPEQWDAKPTDARSDQFSFCVALHEGLLGERPFIKAKVKGTRPTFERSPSGLKKLKEQPRAIRTVLTRGLAPEPAERFPSMEALLLELERAQRPSRVPIYAAVAVLASLTIPAAAFALRSPCHGALERIRAPRAKLGVLPADVATPVKLVGEALEEKWAEAWTEACVETHERKEQPPEVLALRNDCLARQERRYELVLDGLGSGSAQTRADALLALETSPRAVECLAVESLLGVEAPPAAKKAEVAALREAVWAARVAIELGKYAEARQQLTALEPRVVATNYDRLTAEHSYALALISLREAQYRIARDHYHSAFGAALAARDISLASLAGSELLHITGAELGFTQESQLVEATLEPLVSRTGDQALEAKFDLARGNVAMERDRLDDAQRFYERARALRETVFGARHVETARVIDNLGNVATRRGRVSEAEPLHRAALQILEEQLGPRHPLVARSWLVLASSLAEAGRHEEAIEAAQRGYLIRLEVLGTKNHSTQATRAELADFNLAAGRYDEARRLELEGLADASPGSVEQAEVLQSLAQTELEAGRLKEALERCRAAQAIFNAQTERDESALRTVRQLEAEILLQQGAAADAEKILLPLAREWRGQEDSAGELADVLVLVADASVTRNKADAALAPLQEARTLYGTINVTPERLANAQLVRARALFLLNRKADALDIARQARATLANRPAAARLSARLDGWLAHPH